MAESAAKDTPEAGSSINSSGAIDTSFYNWQNFFKALTGRITPEEGRKYLAARDVIKEESDCKRCEGHRDWLFKHSSCTIPAFLQASFV